MQHNTARQSDRQEIDRFGALPLSLLANPEIDPTAKVLLAILSAHMGPKGAWPGISTLAAGVGRDTSTVRRQLCELADLGLLDWSHEMRGGRRLCVYRFTFDRFGGLGLVRTRQLQAEPEQAETTCQNQRSSRYTVCNSRISIKIRFLVSFLEINTEFYRI